jgi:hypothetical protein
MATVTEPSAKPASSDPQVYHPLDRLRGIIRRYVVIEGVLLAALFVVAWFAAAMILDYGVFKAFTWDWVQDGAAWFRAAALVLALGLLGGIVVFRIVRRLRTELTYPALALVLERRFPKVLGDRLITAVELADLKEAARHGYSTSMIRQTIAEARERVGAVPVHEAFNWRRLHVMAGMVAGFILGIVVVAFASHAIAARGVYPAHAGWKLVHVSSILAERNLLLWNTPWPRRALLELDPSIKETGLRVARDGAAPRVKVKSYRWVIADRSAADGWRPLRWSDVTEDRVGVRVPALPYSSLAYPDEKAAMPTDAESWTLDAVWDRARESAVVRDKLSNAMGGDDYQALQKVLDRLEEIAASPSQQRHIRRLGRPEGVAFDYAGAHTGGGGSLNPEGNDEYAGEIGGLREDVVFIIRAEDYRTPPRAVTLVPPPTLLKLSRIEYQPAYLYYAPPLAPNPERPGEMMQLGPSALKGKLQQMREEKLSLTGDKSVFAAPAGSEVVITATTELPIVKAYAQPKVGLIPGGKLGSAARAPLTLLDENTFTIEFRGESRLTAPVEFDLVFENSDGVVSTRPVLIQVTEDQAPVVEVAPEFIRRVGAVYYVTPRARIPFNPESSIADDNGLSKVEYQATYWPEDSPLGRAMRCALVTRALIAPGGLGAGLFPSVVQGLYHANAVRSLDKGDTRQNASFLLASYLSLAGKIVPETQDRLDQLLREPRSSARPELVRRMGLKTDLKPESTRRSNGALESFKWQIEGDYFDVRALNLEVPAGDIQPRYMVELKVKATDTNFDTGPKSSTNGEAMRLLVVSAGDLLYEIGKDEEALGTKLDDAIKKLESTKRKFEYVRAKNGLVGLDEIDPVKVRCRDASQDVTKAKELVQTIVREFRRIEKECIFNQLDEKNTLSYGLIANRIDRALGENPFPLTAAEDQKLTDEDERVRNGGDPRTSFPVVEKVMTQVQTPLDEGRWADNVLVSKADQVISALLRELVEIRKTLGEGESYDKVKREVNALLEEQRRVKAELKDLMNRLQGQALQDTPAIAEVGQIFLRKGESKRIEHAIKWRQYKEDTLVVKVASSDPAGVIVPPELKLDFEKNDLNFDYEIRGGNKEGDFTITLTPAVGAKVQVKVTVK